MKLKLANTQFEFFTLMKIRALVFMDEQDVDPLIEIDDLDATCDQYVVYNDNDTIIGTCRVITQDTTWHLGRIAIVKEERKKQYGSFLLQEIEKIAKENKIHRLELGSQKQAQLFYENNGYQAYGEPYIEANIEHINVEKCL